MHSGRVRLEDQLGTAEADVGFSRHVVIGTLYCLIYTGL